jgi:hypothetical protein
MTALDVADLVVIAGQALGIGTGAALAQIDIATAQAALAEVPPARALPDHAAAAAAGIGLVHALLRHPPFPGHSEQVAVAAGLQFLAVNGWQADLDPPAAAAIVIESLASGQLKPADAAAWLSPRLSFTVPDAKERPVPALQRGLKSVLPLHGPGGAGMFADGQMLARFTDRAATTISLAREEAWRLGHQHIDPEHIVLGLTGAGDGTAVKALHRLGVSLDVLRRQVEESIGQGHGIPAEPIRPSQPRGQKVLNSALPEALIHGTTNMGTGHLLLAQFHDDGPAAQALARLGAGENQVRDAITAVLAEARLPHGQTASHEKRPKRPARAEQTENLRREIARLRELLLRHGIDPRGSDRKSA